MSALHYAAIDWLEVLVPIIVLLGYFFFGNKAPKDGSDKPSPPFAPGQGGDADDGLSDRERQIQEEIRRKILERQRGESGGRTGEATPPPQPQPAGAGPVRRYDPNLPEHMQRRGWTGEAAEEEEMEAVPPPPPIPYPLRRATEERYQPAEPPPLPVATTPAQDYLAQWQAQQEALARVDALAAAMRAQAIAPPPASVHAAYDHGASLDSGDFRAGVVEAVMEPGALRRSIVVLEILSPPVGLRKT